MLALALAALAAEVAPPVGAASTSSSGAATLPPAPVWPTAAGAVPSRPASCPPLTAAAEATSAASPPAASGPSSPTGAALWPSPAAGADPEDYAAEHTGAGAPTHPTNWATDGNDWKLAAGRSTDPAVSANPQELCGVQGNSVDTAWQVTTGRPTTVVAVLDSGIDWCDPGTVEKIALNRRALPPPQDAGGRTKAQLERAGAHFADRDPYDLDGSGVLDVAQYAADPRVAATVRAYGGTFCRSHDDRGYAGLSAEDLIRTFADPRLPGGGANPYGRPRSGPAGFTGAVAGWNFVDDDDDPYDDVDYGHGTGEAQDIAGAADNTSDEVGACPNCMILPVRVGTSFIATGNAFAQGVLFAVDAGATVVSEALGATDTTPTTTQAIAYATAHGVPIVGSAADEESEHANLPGALDGVIDVNSVERETSWSPPSALFLNGCTNDGPEIAVSVESTSCSSEATGKASGTVGLIESAAADAVAAGRIRPYPHLRSATGAPVALSANEVRQLVTLSADDVDFATAAPGARPAAPADNYGVRATVPLAHTARYPTTPGYDIYTGWGRLDAARAVSWVAAGRIPPEAAIGAPVDFTTFAPTGTLVVRGLVAAVRSPSFRYQVDVAPGPAPAPGAWRLVTEGSGRGRRQGVLARVPLRAVAALFPGGAASLTGAAVGAGGQPDPDRFTFSIRVLVRDARGLVGVAQAADFLHADPGLLPGFPKQFAASLVAPPKLAPLGPGGEQVLVVAQASGTVDAFLPDGRQLPGWPVHTALAPGHWGERAYTSGAVTDRPRGEILGGVAVGDLAHAGGRHLDVVATDMAGRVYAWDAQGHLLPGWPRRSDPAFSEPSARDAQNRLLPGFLAAPALGDLTGDGQLDVVAAGLDRHVYAFEPDGRAVPGWPVLVVDPAEVASVDPVTDHVTFKADADPAPGTELVDTPAIGALGGHGPPDVVVGSDEEYTGAPDADLGALGVLLSAADLHTANARVYAIYPDGSAHPAAPGAPRAPGLPDPGAFLPGWPVKVADLDAGLLPTIGDGVTASPALADVSGHGALDVVTGSAAGPLYVLRPDGTSALGTGADGRPKVTAFTSVSTLLHGLSGLLDAPIPALGEPVAAPLGHATRPSLVAPAASVGRLLDEIEPAHQTPDENQVAAWSATSGDLRHGYPALMNDLQFLTQPLVADVGPPGTGSDVVETSGLYDLRAYDAAGRPVPGFPKFTGGWVLYGPVVGTWGSGHQVLVVGTRSGALLAWHTPQPACASPGPWPQVHHDAANTQNLGAPQAAVPSCRAGGR